MKDVWNHPQLAARERWTEVPTPVGPIPALLPPGTPGGWQPKMGSVPALGEHTASILEELGDSQADIERMREKQVI